MTLSCLEFRRVTGADPASRDPAVLEHAQGCAACAEFRREQAMLDRRLQTALRVPVPDELKARIIWRQAGLSRRTRRATWLAAAAGLVLAVGLGLALSFSLVPSLGAGPLPAAVVAHIEHEPELLRPTNARAEPVRVSAVLERGGATLAEPLDNVVHAGLCPFRGALVPHLVLNHDGEPVSVLLLPDEQVAGVEEIHEAGYHGVLAPHGTGAIAIVGARPELVLPVREQLDRAVRWRI